MNSLINRIEALQKVSQKLTKLYEETIRGSVAELIEHFTKKDPKGEFVIVVGGKK